MAQDGAKLDSDALAWLEDGHCFACGADNPQGLHLDLRMEGDSLRTTFTPQRQHQGYANVVHGGILGLILDEILIQLPYRLLKTPIATVELKVRYLKAAKVGEALHFTAEVEGGLDQRILTTRGSARREDGTLVASAEAKCIKIASVVKV